MQQWSNGKKAILIAHIACLSLLSACEVEVELENTAPLVGSLGPVVSIDDNVYAIHLTVADYEEDDVDVNLRYRLGENEWKSIVQAPGAGHGLVGLTSNRQLPGRSHVVWWNTSSIDPDDTIILEVVPVDTGGNTGETIMSQSFTLTQGWEGTVILSDMDQAEE